MLAVHQCKSHYHKADVGMQLREVHSLGWGCTELSAGYSIALFPLCINEQVSVLGKPYQILQKIFDSSSSVILILGLVYGSVNKRTCRQDWQLEFHLQDPHHGTRELPLLSSDIHTHAVVYTCHTHTHTHTCNLIFTKENLILSVCSEG